MVQVTALYPRTLTFSFVCCLLITLSPEEVHADTDVDTCGLWLGPSSVKAQEEHGFGLGMFTGKLIEKDTLMPAERLIPVYDWDDEEHPPLREYVWPVPEGVLTDMVLESLDGMLMFVPGLAAVAPCTSVNFNMKLSHTVSYDDTGVHRFDTKTPHAGAFSYRSNAMFTAVRDILPGEELVVECEEDNFDIGASPDPVFNPQSTSETAAMTICLDDTLEERESFLTKGKGLFTKRHIPQEETVLLSTPMTPIHRSELDMEDDRTQLLLNYCYGHPESILLWLPHGPLINSVNHSREPNARIQWYSLDDFADDDMYDTPGDDDIDDYDKRDYSYANKAIKSRRRQYHHPELLSASPEEVAKIHGKGLVMDLISTRPIALGEEVVIDYGDAWVAEWEKHQVEWAAKEWSINETSGAGRYVSSDSYNQRYKDYEVLTVMEQHRDPYPSNLQTACYFEIDWVPDVDFQDDIMTYESWNRQTNHSNCLLPCLVMERKTKRKGGTTYEIDHDDDDNTDDDCEDASCYDSRYTAKLVDSHEENVAIDWNCHLFKKFEYIYEDIPRHGIIFVDKPYASDVWLPQAFRHPIGVPDEVNNKMYPDIWKKRNIRQRAVSAYSSESQAFKRKNVMSRQDSLDAIRIKTNLSPRADL